MQCNPPHFLSAIRVMYNVRDKNRSRCIEAYRQQREKIILLEAAFAEVAYVMRINSHYDVVTAFFRTLNRSRFRPTSMTQSDVLRAAAIMEQYADAELDFVDAAIVAVAERLSIQDIFTLDQRDFGIIRPKHCDYFRLTPT